MNVQKVVKKVKAEMLGMTIVDNYCLENTSPALSFYDSIKDTPTVDHGPVFHFLLWISPDVGIFPHDIDHSL